MFVGELLGGNVREHFGDLRNSLKGPKKQKKENMDPLEYIK